MLGADNIQGKQHSFIAGNHVYYVGGYYIIQELAQNETIGLTHPFFNDLRCRGTACAAGPHGFGNDFSGWEFYRTTKVAWGTVVADGHRWEHPAPLRQFWRPDKTIVEYELTAPGIAPISIREEKFISATDVVSTLITSSRPVTLEVSGHSFDGAVGSGEVLKVNGTCTADAAVNAIRVQDSGRVRARVSEGGYHGNNTYIYAEGHLMYEGLSSVLTASRPMGNLRVVPEMPGGQGNPPRPSVVMFPCSSMP